MQLCCPVCATEFPLEAGVADDDGKRLAAAFAAIEPPLARALFGYLRLFKPPKSALRSARALKLAQEVAALVAAGKVTRDRLTRPTTPATWIAGMEHMAATRDKLHLPLGGHGYLLEVVSGLAEQQQAQAEQRTEEDRRLGRHRGSTVHTSNAHAELASHVAHARLMHELGHFDEAQRDEHIRTAKQRLGIDA